MRKRLVLWLIVFVFMITSLGGHLPLSVAKTQNSSALSQPEAKYGFFTENKGQWDPSILFVGDTSFGKVAFTQDSVFYQLTSQDTTNTSQTVELSFVSPLTPKIQGLEVLPHYHNYFIGSDQSKWATHCRNFARVTYQDVWSGIDLAYFFTPEGMKYEYYVKPEANIRDLQVRVLGADLTNQESTLHLATKLGSIQDTKLLVFDQKTKKTLQSSFIVNQNSFSFQGIPEKRKNTIVIDPLVYSTYLGGDGTDVANANAVDLLNNHYVTGYTNSTDFPVGQYPGIYAPPGAGSTDVFVSKFDPSGSLLWSTYLGGSSPDTGKSIALDPLGTAVYITGATDSIIDFPTSLSPNQLPYQSSGSVTDCFVTKLNVSGDTLMYSTYLGGGGYDIAEDIAVDAFGCAYITGYAGAGFPTFPNIPGGAYQQFNVASDDCFITKLNPSLSGTPSLIYSTYIGGFGVDKAFGIAVDKLTGVATITGQTDSDPLLGVPFPVTGSCYQSSFNNTSTFFEAFVTQINALGTDLVYSTYLGGYRNEIGRGIALDVSGNIYVCGETDSDHANPPLTGFPITGGAFQTTYDNWTDAFITKLSPSGNGTSDLLYSTFLGGSNYDYAYAIAVDLAGYIYVTGETQSSVQTGTSFPLSSSPEQGTYGGGSRDAFVTKLLPAGGGVSDLIHSTYLGGGGTDIGNCIALDLTGNAYICGETNSDSVLSIPAFPTVAAYQPLKNTNTPADAFVTKISIINIALTGAQLLTYVNLGWIVNNPSAGIAGYKIYRADTSNVSFSYLDTVSTLSLAVTYPDTTATLIGETYSYYVVAVDSGNLPIVTSNTVMVTIIPPIPVVSISLTGSLAFDKVNLVWTVTNPGAIFIQGFQIFRADTATNAYSPLALVNGGNSRSYTDTTGVVGKTYDYYVVALNSGLIPIASSPAVTVGPIQAKPLPNLAFSITLNKTEFEKGEPVLLQVYVHNLSVSQATNVVVTMSLPGNIEFTSVSGFPSTVSGSSVIFPMGNIGALSFKILNIICHVKGNVNADTTTAIGFGATCQENVTATDSANFILKTKKTATSSVSVSVRVTDMEQDPVTGKRFISLGSPLIIEYEIEGGAFPYTLTVNWGDGTIETFVINNADDLKGVLKHLYTSRGTYKVSIKIEDASGQSKQSDFNIDIR